MNQFRLQLPQLSSPNQPYLRFVFDDPTLPSLPQSFRTKFPIPSVPRTCFNTIASVLRLCLSRRHLKIGSVVKVYYVCVSNVQKNRCNHEADAFGQWCGGSKDVKRALKHDVGTGHSPLSSGSVLRKNSYP